MTGSKTHLILTCHLCGASLTLPVTTYQVGDPNSSTGMFDARQAAAQQGWRDRDGHWTCPKCSPYEDPDILAADPQERDAGDPSDISPGAPDLDGR